MHCWMNVIHLQDERNALPDANDKLPDARDALPDARACETQQSLH